MENIEEQVENTPLSPTAPPPKPKKLKQKINTSTLTLALEAEAPATPIINKGTGAGGANTNVTGKSFEQKTENETRLFASGFTRKPIPGYEKKHRRQLLLPNKRNESYRKCGLHDTRRSQKIFRTLLQKRVVSPPR